MTKSRIGTNWRLNTRRFVSFESLRKLHNSLVSGGVYVWFPVLCVYMQTAAPTIFDMDSAEFATAVPTGGLIRATGYPLYLMLGWVWCKVVAIGDFAYRVNLFSVFWSLMTLALLYRVLGRFVSNHLTRALATWLLALTPAYWHLSLIAEVYTMHTALMVLLALTLFYWSSKPSPKRLALVGLATGIAGSHHGAAILLVPGSLLFILLQQPRTLLSFKSILYGVVGTAIGLLPYVYLPIRASYEPAFNYLGWYDASGDFIQHELHTAKGMYWVVSGKVFRGLMFEYPDSVSYWSEIKGFVREFAKNLPLAATGVGFLGGVVLARKRLSYFVLVTAWLIANLIFFVSYAAVDKETMYLPVYLLCCVYFAIGLQWIAENLSAGLEKLSWYSRVRNHVKVLAIVVAALFAVAVVKADFQERDLSERYDIRAQAENQLRAVRSNAIVLSDWYNVPQLEYLQIAEGWRSDVLLINTFLINYENFQNLCMNLSKSRPIYTKILPRELRLKFRTRKEAGLFRIERRRRRPF